MSNEYTSIVPTINPDGRFMIETTVTIPLINVLEDYIVTVAAVEDGDGACIYILDIVAQDAQDGSKRRINLTSDKYMHNVRSYIGDLVENSFYRDQIMEKFYEERDLAIEELR